MQEAEIRKIMAGGQLRQKNKTLSQKYPTQERARGVAQLETLSSNLCTANKNKNKPSACGSCL
jgi:hypothetical protein